MELRGRGSLLGGGCFPPGTSPQGKPLCKHTENMPGSPRAPKASRPEAEPPAPSAASSLPAPPDGQGSDTPGSGHLGAGAIPRDMALERLRGAQGARHPPPERPFSAAGLGRAAARCGTSGRRCRTWRGHSSSGSTSTVTTPTPPRPRRSCWPSAPR